jgi:pyruvate dehydrogenase E1 component alpha subunit
MTLPFDAELARRLYRQMVLIRRFEERSAEEYSAGRIRGFLHLYVGEEAVAAGAIRALGPDDAIVGTYREHGHALARGMTALSVMAEMFGKATGCSRGRGGSMHLFDVGLRFYGGNAIVGGGLPLAAGLALADRMMGRNRVTACFFGDGAAAEGVFQETLNLAALWRLPVLFACENNLYAMGTALARAHAQTDLTVKAAAHGVPAEAVDGMDLVAVAKATDRAVAGIRAGDGPRFLEYRTYRFRPHSMYDPELYRDKEEVESWKARDPIPRFETVLRQAGWLTDRDRDDVLAQVDAEIASAVAGAEAAPLEPETDLTRDVMTPPEAR